MRMKTWLPVLNCREIPREIQALRHALVTGEAYQKLPAFHGERDT